MLKPSTPPPSTTSQGSTAGTIADLHPDILRTHILTRLDGPALATVSCSSSRLLSVSTEDALWKSISSSTWPSTIDPRVSQIISAFPSGHRSFFSDSYPLLHRTTPQIQSFSSPSTTSLISAVDLYYKDSAILSKVQEVETASGWFMSCPFRVDLIDQRESVMIRIKNNFGKNSDDWLNHLEENLKLSWIIIDPRNNRAANMSSRRPVSVSRHWLTGEMLVKYSVVMRGIGRGTEKEYVRCGIEVTCSGKEAGGEVEVREVGMQVEDMEGKGLCGRESLGILVGAMVKGERRGRKGREIIGEREFEEMTREWRVRKQRRERVLGLVCISVGVTVLVAFWSFILFR